MSMTLTTTDYQATAEPTDVLKYYNICQEPFYLLPGNAFIYTSESHLAGIAQLMTFALEFRSGFSLLVGESGVGKTLLVQSFSKMLPWKIRFIKLSERLDNSRRLLSQLAQSLDMPNGMQNIKTVYAQFEAFADAGQHFILLIDDAHMMSDELLASLVELSNYDAKRAGIIKFLLVGQPSLEARLNAMLSEKLAVKAGVKIRMKALERHEIEPYVKHRLLAAGSPEAAVFFSTFAFDEIYHFSVGIPRLVNQLCRKAMRIAAMEGRSRIDERVIESAAFSPDDRRTNGSYDSIIPQSGGSMLAYKPVPSAKIIQPEIPAAQPVQTTALHSEKTLPKNGNPPPAGNAAAAPKPVQNGTGKSQPEISGRQKPMPQNGTGLPAYSPSNGRQEKQSPQNGAPADTAKQAAATGKETNPEAQAPRILPAFKPQLPSFTSPYMEDVHRILENLAISIAEHKFKVIGVISSVAGEGSTTLLAAISYMLTNIHNTRQHSGSENARPLLLIDANIKNPGLHRLLNAGQAPGLQDLAGNHSTVDACLQRFSDSPITLMSAGNIDENFWSRLSPDLFENTLQSLRKQYQKIFIDLPPVLQHGDGITFSKMCDAVVLVIKAGETRHQVVQKAIQLLETAGVPIIGGILNQREFHIPEKIYRNL